MDVSGEKKRADYVLAEIATDAETHFADKRSQLGLRVRLVL